MALGGTRPSTRTTLTTQLEMRISWLSTNLNYRSNTLLQNVWPDHSPHYCDVIMGAMVSQITSLTIVYSTVHSDQRKQQCPASLAFVREFTGDRWNPRTNGQWRGKCFHLMTSSCFQTLITCCWVKKDRHCASCMKMTVFWFKFSLKRIKRTSKTRHLLSIAL